MICHETGGILVFSGEVGGRGNWGRRGERRVKIGSGGNQRGWQGGGGVPDKGRCWIGRSAFVSKKCNSRVRYGVHSRVTYGGVDGQRVGDVHRGGGDGAEDEAWEM